MGFGHVRRSITLARSLHGRVPVKLWLMSECASQGEDLQSHFEGLNWQVGPTPDTEADVEILDLEEPSMLSMLMRRPSHSRKLALDWCNPIALPDLTFNLIDHSGMMRVAYTAADRLSDYVEGPQCAIIRPELRALRPAAVPATAAQVRRIVITLGGADPAKRSLAALRQLAALDSGRAEIMLVSGPLMPSAYEAEIRAAVPRGVKVLRDPPGYHDLLAESDLVLCSGGGTLLESMCLGKPVVVFSQTVAEERHALSHAHAGACVMETSLEAVLASAELRNSIATNAYARVDGRGAERILDAAVKLLERE